MSNPYQTSEFLRIFAWRNRHNGAFVGSLAATHMIDWVMADNCWRSLEFNGAAGMKDGSDVVNAAGGFDGGWGSVALIRPVIIGHDLPCPKCDRDSALIYWGTDGNGEGGAGGGGNWGGFDLWGNMMGHGGWDSPVADARLGYFHQATVGMRWRKVLARPSQGTELKNAKLSAELAMGQIAFSREHLQWLGVPLDLPEDTFTRAGGGGAWYAANRLMQCNTHPMTGKGRRVSVPLSNRQLYCQIPSALLLLTFSASIPLPQCSGSHFYSGMALRIGLAAPQATGLYVTHATFINFDRPGMLAVSSANRNCTTGKRV